jgi:nitrate reductase gamma subunit
MSETLHFAAHTLQEVALGIMAVVYTIRLIWLFRFKGGKERQPETGLPGTTKAKGIMYSWLNVAMPWAMESTRRNFFMYLQFVVFHVGVVAAIGLSFVIPYFPQLLTYYFVVIGLQISIGAACAVGLMRIVRRVASPVMRKISSPDDYFSLILLTTWFFFAFLAVPNSLENGETIMLVYFILTAFFLIYVPFSKISHYLYYPFTRYWFGKSMGYRGIYPIVHKNK